MQNSCSKQIFGKLTGRSTVVHKKNCTVDILLGIIQKPFREKSLLYANRWLLPKRTLLLEKMSWYDKSIGSFKMRVTQERRGRRLTKKVTKKYIWRGFAARKIWCYSLKKNKKKRDFASDVLFDADLFFCIFCECGFFVDDVISFSWNK